MRLLQLTSRLPTFKRQSSKYYLVIGATILTDLQVNGGMFDFLKTGVLLSVGRYHDPVKGRALNRVMKVGGGYDLSVC